MVDDPPKIAGRYTEDVVCQREDLTSGYAMLCVMMNERQPKLVKE